MGSGASIGDVAAKLTLESAEFDSKLAKSGEGLDRHAALTEKASERARKAWEKELVAQANAQRATEQAARVKELAALKADILSRSTEHLEHATVSQMQATSAAVRSLKGNPGIRAVERFLTTIPGVGQALMGAFPVVGAVAFGAVVVDMTAKVVEFVKNIRDMPKTIGQAFGSLNLAQRTTIDELDLATDKLQNALDKMRHKPENNLKVAFDEAKLAADRLAASIESSNAKLNELLSRNHINGVQVLFGAFGTKSTASVEGTAKAFGVQADNNAFDLADATSRGDTAGIARARKALLDTQNAFLENRRKDLQKEQAANSAPPGKLATAASIVGGIFGVQVPTKTNPNNQAVIQDDKGIIQNILNQQKEDAARQLNTQKEAEKQVADDKKAAAEEAKAAAAKRLQDFEAQLAAQKLIRGESVKLDYEFWQQKQMAFRAGSEQYNSIVAKEAQLSIEAIRQAHEKIKQFQAQQNRLPTDAEGSEIIARANKSFQDEAIKRGQIGVQINVDTNERAILQARNDARQQEAELTDKAGRTITEYAAALQFAKVHAAEFKVEMEALESVLNARAAMAFADPTRENIRARDQASDAIVQRQAQRQLEERADNTRISGRDSDGLVGATDALREFVNATKDSASELRNLTTTALSGFNAEAIKGISGQRTSFAGFGAGLGRDVAGAALRKGEGSLLGAFGLGGDKTRKPAGTTGDPIHVMVANIQAFQGAPKMPNLMPDLDTPLSSVPFSNFLPGGGGGTMPSVGSLLGTALSLIPGFASGGAIDPNEWAIVGEEGPEIINGGKAGGNVIPNSKLMSAGQYGSGKSSDQGGGADKHYHTWNVPVDARGATDPAAINAAVQRGIKAAAPHIAAAGVRATAEQRMRGPSSKRG